MSTLRPLLVAVLCASCAHQPSPSALARHPLVAPQAAPIDFARSWPKRAALRPEQTLRVVLPLRTGSGFSWRVRDPLPTCLTLTSETTMSSIGSDPGVPNEQILNFTATSLGEGDLVFCLTRAGDNPLNAVEIRTTRVLVSAE